MTDSWGSHWLPQHPKEDKMQDTLIRLIEDRPATLAFVVAAIAIVLIAI